MRKLLACMAIPLESHMYRLTTIGELHVASGWHGPAWASRDHDLVGYELTAAAKEIVERPVREGLNPAYCLEYIAGQGVSLVVPDHSFGRGLMTLLHGWEYIASAPRGEIADKVEQLLRTKGRGPFIRSSFYGSSAWMEAFSLKEEEDLLLAQLSFCQIEAKRSSLPKAKVIDGKV